MIEVADPHAPGLKLDSGKPAAGRGLINYFPAALLEVAKVSTFGSQKYTWGGWKSVEDGIERYRDAMVRHLLAHASGEETDPESGLSHLAHLAWGALAILQLETEK